MKIKSYLLLSIIIFFISCKPAAEYYKNQYSIKANKEKVYKLSDNFDVKIKKVWSRSMHADMGANHYAYVGYYFANITVNITNNSNEKLEFAFNDFSLINENGVKYPVKYINYGPFDSKFVKPIQSKSKELTFLCDTQYKPHMLVHKNPEFKPIIIEYTPSK